MGSIIEKIFVFMKELFFRRHIKKHSKISKIVAGRDDYLKLSRNSLIELSGKLILGANRYGRNGRSSILIMRENTILDVKGNFNFMYGADIILFPNSRLILGNHSFINSDCKVRCHNNISIGDNCSISHDFTIMDSDVHYLNGENHTAPVIIGNNVWIGTRVTILSGVHVGDNAVIAAGALVNTDVPSGCLVGGVPAHVIKENITWRL